MDYLECLATALVIAIPAASWLYRKVKSPPRQPRNRQVSTTTPPASAASTLPARPRWVLLSLASAIAAFVTVSAGSYAAAHWISLRLGVPPDIVEAMEYAPGLFICVAGPIISLLAGALSAIIHRVVREFQSRELPLTAHIVIGGAVGLVLTLIPAAFLVAGTCTAEFPC